MPAPSRGRGVQTAPEKGSVPCGHSIPFLTLIILSINVLPNWVFLNGFIVLS